MHSSQYALCVKFADVNPAQILAAARKHKVALLHVENYNSKKNYNHIFEEYSLEMPKDSHIQLLFICSGNESFLADKENLVTVFEKLNQYFLQK